MDQLRKLFGLDSKKNLDDFLSCAKVILGVFIFGVAAGGVAGSSNNPLIPMVWEALGAGIIHPGVASVYLHNLMICVVMFLSGFFIWKWLPALIILYNGTMIGYSITVLFMDERTLHRAILIIAGVAPHGVLELGTVILVAALGMHLGKRQRVAQVEKGYLLIPAENLWPALRCLSTMAVTLFVAAFIEMRISTKVIEFLR